MKKILYVQVGLLLATVVVGGFLSKDLSDDLRTAHRLFASLSGVTALVAVVVAFTKQQSMAVKALAILALLLVIGAGVAGRSIGSGADYNTALNAMRACGILALLTSIVGLVLSTRLRATQN